MDALDALRAHTQEIVEVALIIVVTLVVERVASRRIPKRFPSASLIVSIVRITVFSVGLLVAFGSLGISITPVLTALGVGGLAVALALRDTLANLFAGIQLLASRQVMPGDFIRFDGGEGYVRDITWRNTSVIDVAGARIIVPNEKLAGTIVTNAMGADGVRLTYAFGLPRKIDVALAIAAVRRIGSDAFVEDVFVTGSTDAMVSYVVVFALPLDARERAFKAKAAVAEATAALAASAP